MSRPYVRSLQIAVFQTPSRRSIPNEEQEYPIELLLLSGEANSSYGIGSMRDKHVAPNR